MSKWLERFLADLRRAFAPPAPGSPGATTAVETSPSPQTGDDLDLSTVSWLGTPVYGAKMEFILSSASIKGEVLRTMFHPYSWPSKVVGGVPCDAVVHLFYEMPPSPYAMGGKFDYFRDGGQREKTLENVITGYHGHAMPRRGMKTWTMISSHDGKRRSNTVKVEWR